MVALKIQTLDDIVKAYLQSLGFSQENCDISVSGVIDKLQNDFDDNNVIYALDELIYKTAKKIFAKEKLSKSQKIAMFKLCFLQSDGASKWGVDALFEDAVSVVAVGEMKEQVLRIVPEYNMSKMEPQIIEFANPIDVVKKFF